MGLVLPPGGATPWLIDLDANLAPVVTTGSRAVVADNQCLYGGYAQSGGTQGEQYDCPVVLGTGTWTVVLMCVQSMLGGIITVSLDDGSGSFSILGTVDLYSSLLVRNAAFSFTGVGVLSTGKKDLRLAMLTKNPSATNYYLFLQHITLSRTS